MHPGNSCVTQSLIFLVLAFFFLGLFYTKENLFFLGLFATKENLLSLQEMPSPRLDSGSPRLLGLDTGNPAADGEAEMWIMGLIGTIKFSH